MIVQCVSTVISDEDVLSFGEGFHRNRSYPHLALDKQYLVFGIEVSFQSRTLGRGIYIDILDSEGILASVPLLLFKIIDGRLPDDWIYHSWGNGNFALWPSSFLKHKYFHQDLADGVAIVVAEFEEVKKRYESEFCVKDI